MVSDHDDDEDDDDDNNNVISLVEIFQEQSRWQLELFDRMEIKFRIASASSVIYRFPFDKSSV